MHICHKNMYFYDMNQPLAERIRPQQLSDYISQLHLVGPEDRKSVV